MQPPRAASRTADRRPLLKSKSLDGVLPTAIKALGCKREAMRVLRDIDALLFRPEDDDEMTATLQTVNLPNGSRTLRNSTCDGGSYGNATERATPGPGAYSPRTRIVDKQTHFLTKFDAYSGRNRRALSWKLVKRSSVTPGPGAYNASSADNVTKPKVVSASFSRLTSTHPKEIHREDQHNRELSSVTTSEFNQTSFGAAGVKSCGLVGYKPPTKPNYRTREQKQRVRSVLASRKRWKHLGYYDVSHTCVEQRLGATMVVPMAQQSDYNKSKRPHPVQLRRKLRLWRSSNATLASPESNSKEASGSKTAKKTQARETEKEKASYKTTEQWQRTQIRQLLRVKELKAKVISQVDDQSFGATTAGVPHKKEPSSLFMTAHAMSKQLGRDSVKCRQKKLKIVSSFSAKIQKERTKPHVEAEDEASSVQPRRAAGGIVSFAKTTGRDDVQIDKHGVYLLSKETEQFPEANEPSFDQVDKILLPRPPTALISAPEVDEERFPMTAKVAKEQELLSVLEQKFEIVETSVPGHRFVRFERQLDRPDFILSSDNHAEQELVLPSEFPILEKLKFTGTNQEIVDYSKMQGRDDAGRRGGQQILDLVYEPVHNHKLPRAPAPVDMGKILPRASTILDSINDDAKHKDQVLFKLRKNHDEIEKALRLLSKFKRADVGFVDMRKTTARFQSAEDAHNGNQGETYDQQRSSCLELSVLSSKARVDRTLVDVSRNLGRWRSSGDPGYPHQHDNMERTLVLNVKDDLLSKRKRSVGLVDMKNQIPRRETIEAGRARFLDPTRDSATTRFLRRQMSR